MGTPHNGHTNTHTISLGKTIASVVKYVSGNAHNNIMDAAEGVSEFTETLKEHWRHHLEKYAVISCYVTKDIVSRHLILPFRSDLFPKANFHAGGSKTICYARVVWQKRDSPQKECRS
jgi:hypothetical protein